MSRPFVRSTVVLDDHLAGDGIAMRFVDGDDSSDGVAALIAALKVDYEVSLPESGGVALPLIQCSVMGC